MIKFIIFFILIVLSPIHGYADIRNSGTPSGAPIGSGGGSSGGAQGSSGYFQYNNGGNFAAGSMYTDGTNVGIGTTTLPSQLVITNNMSIGNAAFTAVSAPTFGANIQGNVGIGTSNPGVPLDINGAVRASSFVGTSTGISYTTGNLGVSSTNPGAQLDVWGTARIFGTLSVQGTLTLPTAGITNFAGGNVGIGSAVPGMLLDVQGSIRSSSLSSQNDGTIICIKGTRLGYCSGGFSASGAGSCTCT